MKRTIIVIVTVLYVFLFSIAEKNKNLIFRNSKDMFIFILCCSICCSVSFTHCVLIKMRLLSICLAWLFIICHFVFPRVRGIHFSPAPLLPQSFLQTLRLSIAVVYGGNSIVKRIYDFFVFWIFHKRKIKVRKFGCLCMGGWLTGWLTTAARIKWKEVARRQWGCCQKHSHYLRVVWRLCWWQAEKKDIKIIIL